jgi:hypothetical protein
MKNRELIEELQKLDPEAEASLDIIIVDADAGCIQHESINTVTQDEIEEVVDPDELDGDEHESLVLWKKW